MSDVAISEAIIVGKAIIYKIAHIVNNKIKAMFVFIGLDDKQKQKQKNLDSLFLKNPLNPIFSGIFTEDELSDINEFNITVKFIHDRLHLDDTIEIIKKKLLLHMMNDLNCSFDEIYLFIRQYETFNAITLYQNLTQNEKLELSRERLVQFLLNIPELDINTLEDKPLYTYADIVSFNLEQAPMIVSKPLGQKIISLNSEYPYTINPFDAEVYDPFLEKFADEITTTTNKTILMQYGSIINNTLYLCLAEDVLGYAALNNLSENSTLKIYYPYLYGKDITTPAQLEEKKQALLGDTRALLTKVFEKNCSNINLFYDIYENRTKELKFSNVGIKSILFEIRPLYSFNLPLDIVFKLIHATQDIPLIKMNLSKKQENIYRLYADKMATNGKKIPYLDKGTIFKWDKVMGKSKSVAVYIEHYEATTTSIVPIVCEFKNDGTILINATFGESITLDALNEIIIKEVNPVINIVKEYLAQSGYNMSNFISIKNDNIEIINIDYTLHIPIEKQINIKNIIGCVSSMFNVINNNLEQGIILRFKRVANYNEMESQDAMIVDMSNPYLGYSDNDIIKALQTNFHLLEEQARTKYVEVKRAQDVMQFANRKLKLKSITNPGFLTTIVKQPFHNVIMINVTGINNISYLNTLYVYLDSLIRITQNQGSTKIPKSIVKNICKGHKAEEEKPVEEIIAIAEQPMPSNEHVVMNIVAEELVFNKEPDIGIDIGIDIEQQEPAVEEIIDEEDLLARFGYDEEEEEEDEINESGGAKKNAATGEADTGEADTGEANTGEADTGEADTDDDDENDDAGVEGAEPLKYGVEGAEPLKYGVEGAEPLKYGVEGAEPLKYGVEGAEPLKYGVEGAEPLDDWAEEEENLIKTDITGLNLSHPNPFSKRMEKRDKTLFYSENGEKNFKSYSRGCPWNMRRQPVILTEEEKDKIDKEHPESYSQAVSYSSTPSKKFWYICPRYWSLRDNTSLRPDEVNPNEVIPKNASEVPPGKHIFEFNDYGKEHLDSKKQYVTHYPGFLKPGKNKNDACLPCCFKSWKGVEQTMRRAQCTNDENIVIPPGRKKKKAEEIDEYILSHDKFPIIQYNRFGYLPLAIQKFLHTDNKKCQISELNTNLKENHTCLLRHSVEIHQTQSFIACIADIWFSMIKNKEKSQPTIKRMKEIFIEAMSIDTFITLQNGNLIQLFNTTETINPLTDTEDYAEIFSQQKSKLYDATDKTNPAQMNTLIKIVKAYLKFIEYLRDDLVTINYAYLWDLICKPNPKLFPNGVNLVILELMKTDITDNVEIICPSNHYSSSFFDAKKSVLIILKINNFYEPIYAYESKNNEINITRHFNLMYKETLPNIKHTLNLIKKSLNGKCGALSSMPMTYKFEKNLPLDRIIHYLEIRNYLIDKQVLNYDSKVIGVVAINKDSNTKCFIPCFPSAPSAAMSNLVWMDDVYTDTYEKTKSFLEKVYNETKRQVPCKPVIKVIEDGLIVGLLTLSNQFVQLSEPTQDTFGNDLKVVNNLNYISTDKKISNSENVDDDRINYIKKIKLETNFYNVFRNTARYLLGQFQHNELRHEIESKSVSTQLYLKKIHSIEQLLRNLMAQHVVFHDYAENDLLALSTVTNCYGKCKNKPYCKNKSQINESDNDSDCALKVPRTNLINQKSNDEFYFGKLADEIVRYSRIKTFIFNPKNVLTFTTLKYNLRDNEIILLQSLLTQEYFQDLVAAPVNSYISSNTYETTQPITSQTYSPVESYEQFIQPDIVINKEICKTTVKDKIASSRWQPIFPLKCKELLFHSDPRSCSFMAMLTIIQNYSALNKNVTKNSMKEILAEEYIKLYEKYDRTLLDILKAQGKKLLSNQVNEKQLNLSDLIISEDYYATNLDIWILIVHFNIPVIFISETSLLENSKSYMVANSIGGSSEYYFLKMSASLLDKPPIYTLITDENNNFKINSENLRSETIKDDIKKVPSGNTLIKFIEGFTLKYANQRKKRGAVPPRAPQPLAESGSLGEIIPPTAPLPVPSVAPPIKTVKPKTVKLLIKQPAAPPTAVPPTAAPSLPPTLPPGGLRGLQSGRVSPLPLVKKLGTKLKLAQVK